MGAFGVKNFQNDPAMDFEEEFIDNSSLETLKNALLLSKHDEGEEYLEVDEACAALAAAEIIAASMGKPSTDLPDTLQDMVTTIQAGSKLQKLARQAVTQIITDSELKELWAEGDNLQKWLAVQADLLERLK